MKDTFTLADLANFKLEDPKVEPQSAEPAEQPAESSIAKAASSDEIVETPEEAIAADDSAIEVDESTTDTAAAPEAKPKGKKTAREFINELADERDALRRFNEYLLAKEQSQIVPTVTPVAQALDALPTLEANGFDVAKYEEAMKAYTTKQVEAAKSQGAEQAVAASAQAKFNERMAAYAKANPRVVTVLGNPNLPQLAKDAAAVVVESELGPQILEYLGSNPDQAVRIAKRTPSQQAADIGRIEGELRAKSKTPQKTPQITRAPNPPTPTSGRGNTPSVDPNKMSTKEWIAWDRQQETERRRARKGARSA